MTNDVFDAQLVMSPDAKFLLELAEPSKMDESRVTALVNITESNSEIDVVSVRITGGLLVSFKDAPRYTFEVSLCQAFFLCGHLTCVCVFFFFSSLFFFFLLVEFGANGRCATWEMGTTNESEKTLCLILFVR